MENKGHKENPPSSLIWVHCHGREHPSTQRSDGGAHREELLAHTSHLVPHMQGRASDSHTVLQED